MTGQLYLNVSGSYDVRRMANTLTDNILNFKYTTVEKAIGSWDDSNKHGQSQFQTIQGLYLIVNPQGDIMTVGYELWL